MTSAALTSPPPAAQNPFTIHPILRGIIAIAAIAMTVLSAYAMARLISGAAPSHPNLRDLAIMIHVAAVLPAVPLGGFLLLAPKGTRMHKQLGKFWVALMVVTATSAIFIKTSDSFSWIHIFVPLTLVTAWKIVATARAGNIAAHKKHIIGMYLGAMMLPGIAAFAIPSRVMNVLAFG